MDKLDIGDNLFYIFLSEYMTLHKKIKQTKLADAIYPQIMVCRKSKTIKNEGQSIFTGALKKIPVMISVR